MGREWDDKAFAAFEAAQAAGRRFEARRAVRRFVGSFADDAARAAWTRRFLAARAPAGRIRRELYREVIFPALREGYRADDPWALYWLARTQANLVADRRLHRQVDRARDLELLARCYALVPADGAVQAALLEVYMARLAEAVERAPRSLAQTLGETPGDLLDAVAFARRLDTGFTHGEVLDEYEAAIRGCL